MGDWLDVEPAAPQDPPTLPADDEWLKIEDPNAGKTTAAFRNLVDACMRGTDRVMACDGQFLAYRPFNRAFDKETNPRTKERMAMFLEKGHYTHLGTYDEVEIYRLEPGNPYRHDAKQYVIGKDRWADIRKAATCALHRAWADYHDVLGAMATAIKSGRDPLFSKMMWEDTLNQVAITIKQMGGDAAPSEREINEGFTGIRRARGISSGGVLATLNSDKLQKVQLK